MFAGSFSRTIVSSIFGNWSPCTRYRIRLYNDVKHQCTTTWPNYMLMPFIVLYTHAWTFSCCLACDDGTYGQNCSFTCGKCVTNTCTKHNGTCTRGCSDGFTGVLCTQAVIQDPTSSGPIIGAVVGSVVAVFIIGIVIAMVRRKR